MTVQIDQVYKDLDGRMGNRHLKVMSLMKRTRKVRGELIELEYANCLPCRETGAVFSERITVIRGGRLESSKFKLVLGPGLEAPSDA